MWLSSHGRVADQQDMTIPCGRISITGDLCRPANAHAVVVFAHGHGSSRASKRHRHVAAGLQQAGLATLLLDLLTPDEERMDEKTAEFRFNIVLLAERLSAVSRWLQTEKPMRDWPVGYLGESTGASAVLLQAAEHPAGVGAVVSFDGRPDLVDGLSRVQAPTLFIVGSEDKTGRYLHSTALAQLPGTRCLEIVPGASYRFEEPGALERMTELARDWFLLHLRG